MKNSKWFALAAAVFMFAACEKAPEGVSKVTLDKETASVEVGKTITLNATVEPAGAADVTWSSSNTSVATVDAGVVTGVAEGTAMVVATAGGQTATCLVTVVKEGEGGEGGEGGENPSDHASLKGSEYYPIILDGVTAEQLGSKIITDFRPDETTKFLYVWENTYAAGTAQGMNFYGNTEGYTALTVTQNWSGFGFLVPNDGVKELYDKIQASPEDYYFHMAIKSTDNYSHCFYLFGAEATSKFVLGSKSVYDGPVRQDFTRDGSWQEIEIPMSELNISAYDATAATINLFVGLTEGVPGAALNLDAVFFYKK